jgi:hypothetical protein
MACRLVRAMAEPSAGARPPGWPAGLNPALYSAPGSALGPGGRLPREVLLRRFAIVGTLILLLGLAKLAVSLDIIKITSLRPSVDTVVPGLLLGVDPDDADLQDLAADYRVDGVINLASPAVAEQATAASLHQGYLYLPLAPDGAPTWPELRTLASFLRRYTAGGAAVYVHDDTGGPRTVTTAVMLLLVRGQVWDAAWTAIASAEPGWSLPGSQQLAIQQLWLALHPSGSVQRGNPYARARFDPW